MDFSVKPIARLKSLPKPEDGLRAVMERAPQAEAMAARAIEKTRPVWTWIYEERRRVATAGVLVLTVWLGLHVMFGSNGMVIYRQKKGTEQILGQVSDPGRLADLVAGYLEIPTTERQALLEMLSVEDRLRR